MSIDLEGELARTLLRRLNSRVMRFHIWFWMWYILTWILMVLFVFFILVETDLVVQP